MLKFETDEEKACLKKAMIAATVVAVVLLAILVSVDRLTLTPFVLLALLWGVIVYLAAENFLSEGTAEAETAPAPKAASKPKSDPKKAEAAPAPAPAPVTAAAAAPAPAPVAVDRDGDGVVEGKDEGTRPSTLSAPRDGAADDLKRIKGIGPKLEIVCNKLGFYHFDQIAAWTPDEVAWVDSNLEGFQGRVTRDDWVAQAKLLASGGETEFSKRVDDGSVPSSR
ncbi:MAG: hypothetical protein AAF565_08860 [Pseudomonadota bacterium]